MGKKNSDKKSSLSLFLGVLGLVLLLGTAGLSFLTYLDRNDGLRLESIEVESSESIQIPSDILQEKDITVTKDGQETLAYNGKYGELLSNPEQMLAQNAYMMDNPSNDTYVLRFVGDVLLDPGYSIMANHKKRTAISDSIMPEVLELLRGADVFMLNNEFPYSNRGTPLENKAFTFHADPASIAIVKDMGTDIVSLANNHISDFGEISLLDTLDTLQGAQLPYVGAGRNLAEAQSAVYFVGENTKIGILSATQIERLSNPDTKGATETSPGTMRCMQPELFAKCIEETKKNCDIVIAYVHWGSENTTELDWQQREQAKLFAEAGADVIIGDHPHVLQGIDYEGSTPVFYSMGNFWFNSKELDTGIAEITVTKDQITQVRFIPCIQKNCTVSMANATEKERIYNKLRELSTNVSIDADGVITGNNTTE